MNQFRTLALGCSYDLLDSALLAPGYSSVSLYRYEIKTSHNPFNVMLDSPTRWPMDVTVALPRPVSLTKEITVNGADNIDWEAISNSSWYLLWVNDDTGTPIKKGYTAEAAGCADQ